MKTRFSMFLGLLSFALVLISFVNDDKASDISADTIEASTSFTTLRNVEGTKIVGTSATAYPGTINNGFTGNGKSTSTGPVGF